MDKNMFDNVFQEESEIPKEYRITPINQTTFLAGGNLVEWQGDFQKVYSPICVKNGDKIEQVALGSYPLLGEKEALLSLESAAKENEINKEIVGKIVKDRKSNFLSTDFIL